MKCSQCGFENTDHSKHCLNCGARMDGNILCPKCGEAISPDYEKCPHCGKKIPHIHEEEVSPIELGKKERVFSIFNKIFLIMIIAILACSMGIVWGEYIRFYHDGELIKGTAGYFLFDSWKNLKEDLSFATGKMQKASLYFEYVSQFVIVLINIVFTLLSGIFGIISSAKSLRKKGLKECKSYRFLCITFLSNLTAMVMLLSFHPDMGDLKSAFSSSMQSYCWTLTLAMFVMSVFSIVIRHQNGKRSLTFEKIVFSLNFFVSIAMIVSLAFTVIQLKEGDYSLRIASLFSIALGDAPNLRTSNNGIALIFSSSALVLFGLIELFILASLAIFFSIGFYTDQERSMRFKIPCYGLSFFALVLSLIELAASISTAVFISKVYGVSFTTSYLPIVNVILGQMLFGASIASLSISRKYRRYLKLAEQTSKTK